MNPSKPTDVRSAQDMEDKILSPLVSQWIGRLEAAQKSKEAFQEVADQCDFFFKGDLGFMWKDDFRNKYMPNLAKPGIQVSLAKAFELVAIFGPTGGRCGSRPASRTASWSAQRRRSCSTRSPMTGSQRTS